MSILKNANSLTQWLTEVTKGEIAFNLLHQAWQNVDSFESEALSLSAAEPAWCREISFSYRAKNWVLARTIIPKATFHFMQQDKYDFVRPLGTYLFDNNQWQREKINLFQINAEHVSLNWVKKFSTALLPLDARYSIFSHADKKLLITEVFLPEFLHV